MIHHWIILNAFFTLKKNPKFYQATSADLENQLLWKQIDILDTKNWSKK